MLKILFSRLKQGYRTIEFPSNKIKLSPRFMGLPKIDSAKCGANCRECQKVCPTGAINLKGGKLFFDLGRCLFCGECRRVCSSGVIFFSKEYRMAGRKREDLILSDEAAEKAEEFNKEIEKIFGRSLKLRQVSAGGCNGCELDTNVLNTIIFDLSRFGVQFVASPRHADGLLITGPVTEKMKGALEKTYNAVPSPKIVIAVGACAIAGGPYINHPEVHNGASSVVPVDLYVPGCPPHPLTILDGILRVLGRNHE